jgi:hypothetical protein
MIRKNLKKIVYFILTPIVLTTVGEFFLKHQINGLVQNDLSVISSFLHLGILLPLIAIITGGILWVIAMSKFELSFL